MLVMVVFFIAFRWIHLSTPLIRLFLLVLILLLMPTLNFLPDWFALSLLRFRSRAWPTDCGRGRHGTGRGSRRRAACAELALLPCVHAHGCRRSGARWRAQERNGRRDGNRRGARTGVQCTSGAHHAGPGR